MIDVSMVSIIFRVLAAVILIAVLVKQLRELRNETDGLLKLRTLLFLLVLAKLLTNLILIEFNFCRLDMELISQDICNPAVSLNQASLINAIDTIFSSGILGIIYFKRYR